MLVGDVRCPINGDGMLLKVVRRQPVIIRSDKRLEERPGPSGEHPEKEGLSAVNRDAGRAIGLLIHQAIAGEKNRDLGWSRDAERDRPRKRKINHRDRGEGRGDPHRPAGGCEVRAAMAIELLDGFHSRSRFRVTSRQAARRIASRLKKAS